MHSYLPPLQHVNLICGGNESFIDFFHLLVIFKPITKVEMSLNANYPHLIYYNFRLYQK